MSEGTTATGQWACATTGRATDPSRIRSRRPRAGAPTTTRAASSDSRTRAAAGGPHGTATATSWTSSRRARARLGGPVEDAVRPLVEVLGQARRPGDQGLVGRELDLRVDDRHQAQRCPEPGGLVGCPVDDRLVGGRTVDGDDHCSADAEELVAGAPDALVGRGVLTSCSAMTSMILRMPRRGPVSSVTPAPPAPRQT